MQRQMGSQRRLVEHDIELAHARPPKRRARVKTRLLLGSKVSLRETNKFGIA